MILSGVMLGSIIVIWRSLSLLFKWVNSQNNTSEISDVNLITVVKFPIHLFFLTIASVMILLGSGIFSLSHF